MAHTVVGFFTRLVQYGVGLDHVIHHITLGDLFGAELLWSGQVLPIVVAQVIVADNGGWLWKERGELIKISLFGKHTVPCFLV